MHPVPPRLINRANERARLLALADEPARRLALVTGRRRIGKTYLLTHAWGDRPWFYFTAANTTGGANRRQLIRDFARHTQRDLPEEDYPTWRTVFRELLSGPRSPRVVVLDEFQYLANGERGLGAVASELNAAWEQPGSTPLLLVLSGSALGTMNALAAGGSPLYGRFAYHTVLRPFGHAYARELTGIADLRTATEAFACFGGTPRYLAAYRPERGFRQNVEALLLSPTGEVRQLIETALDQEEGLREVSAYRAILDAVAGGMTERTRIAQRAGLANDAGLRRRLRTLVDLDYLRARRNFDAKPNAPVRYALADLAFRFQSFFVTRYRSQLDRLGPGIVYREAVKPLLATYVGKAFEDLVHGALDVSGGRGGIPVLAELGRWEGADRDRRLVEIDIVGRTFGSEAVTGEVKWNAKPLGPGVHERHLGKLRALADSGQAWARQALAPEATRVYVSAAGFAGGWPASERIVRLGLEELYGL